MTEQEYRENLEELRKIFDRGVAGLNARYLKENNRVKIGDIIEDWDVLIKVEKYEVCSEGGGAPYIRYTGRRVGKNGQPTVCGGLSMVYSWSVRTINGEPVDRGVK